MVSHPFALTCVVAVTLTSCGHDYVRWIPKTRPSEVAHAESRAGSAGDQRASEVTAQAQRIAENKSLLMTDRAQSVEDEGRIDALAVYDPNDRAAMLKFYMAFRAHSTPAEADISVREAIAAANRDRLAAMYGEERASIAAAGRDPELGLALSGGGIRSASFSGGVLQALHELGLLKEFGYLSTVSGGGYTGGWYMLRSRQSDAELFAPGDADAQHISQNGFFLTAGGPRSGAWPIVGRELVNLALIPAHLLFNGLVDFDVNTRGARDDYRNGIGTSFLYDVPMNTEKITQEAYGSMASLLPSASRQRPFWIVNCHLALNDEKSGFRARSGCPFEITPLHCGADNVGYVNTVSDACSADIASSSFMLNPTAWANEHYWMTPLYAVAISGAAADSSSLQGNIFEYGLLQATNFDLGYYVDGWSRGWLASDHNSTWNNFLYYGLSPELVFFGVYDLPDWFPFSLFRSNDALAINFEGHPQNVNGKKFYLTDGAHFENLGAYALVKRGCRTIVISDATQDQSVDQWDDASRSRSATRSAAFDDLRRLEERLYADFGAELEIDWEHFDPEPDGCGEFGGGPTGDVMLGRIRNLPVGTGKCLGPCDEVVIVYVKAAYDVSARLRDTQTFIDREKLARPKFPNDDTSDVFYSESDVLAYRALGRAVVLKNARLLRAAMRGDLHGQYNFQVMRESAQ